MTQYRVNGQTLNINYLIHIQIGTNLSKIFSMIWNRIIIKMRHKSTYFYVNYGIYASMWVLNDKDIKHKTQSKNFKKIYFLPF